MLTRRSITDLVDDAIGQGRRQPLLPESRQPNIPSPALRRAAGGDEKDGGKSFFDCGICLDLARDPVVTRCGHLFCWPCLYRWLRVKECSVCKKGKVKECLICKGEETDKNMTPIYGQRTVAKEDDSWIPLRPHARHRVASLRQTIHDSSTAVRGLISPREPEATGVEVARRSQSHRDATLWSRSSATGTVEFRNRDSGRSQPEQPPFFAMIHGDLRVLLDYYDNREDSRAHRRRR